MIRVLAKRKYDLRGYFNKQSLRKPLEEFRSLFVKSGVHLKLAFFLTSQIALFVLTNIEAIEQMTTTDGVAFVVRSNIHYTYICKLARSSPIEFGFVDVSGSSTKIMKTYRHASKIY